MDSARSCPQGGGWRHHLPQVADPRFRQSRHPAARPPPRNRKTAASTGRRRLPVAGFARPLSFIM
ncbi:MAG: hypothetical protein LBP98_10435 [Tannerella sp.]|nr:hypothetical protein [Tannerella sp.]